MNRSTLKTAVILAAAFTLLAGSSAFAKGMGKEGKWSSKAKELRLTMRSLWEDHIFWARNVVLTTKLGDSAAAKVGEEQVVENAKAIANAIVPYYGKEAGDKLLTLLAGHWGAVKEYMTADFAGNKEGKSAAMEKMTKNANDIATFLSSANPNWPKDTLVSALAAHGGFHMAQIDQISAKDFSAEAKTWEGMKTQVYGIADTLTDGIIKQFPQKFGQPSV